ncbi:MAG: hypothetical protein JOZ78_11390 [Chroococcidiopsidaceae cyanobacterium CP_BM_ER_R8_30]|nr:hypothetical protein [Chroococcidiopsidaceae cyanobacterium CP_BM_ER_R8_30]
MNPYFRLLVNLSQGHTAFTGGHSSPGGHLRKLHGDTQEKAANDPFYGHN